MSDAWGGSFGSSWGVSWGTTAPTPPAAPDSTPGVVRHLPAFKRHSETEEEKLARRIREGTIQALKVLDKPDLDTARAAYAKEAAKLTAGIARFRIEAANLRGQIAALRERQQTEEIEGKLLRAEQAALLATVQEQVFLEELEVLDIAYFAAMALNAWPEDDMQELADVAYIGMTFQ